jgi:UDP-2,4-diacetamido-2,4,6-trideoxy-beta-L-altropyranose hydrolase
MRCLTLADALQAKGAQCYFISRPHPGHLIEVIRERGYITKSLISPDQTEQTAIYNCAIKAQDSYQNQRYEPSHAGWLGSTWQDDARETAEILVDLQPDWLVVDHYALDKSWEQALAPYFRKLLVIDDLADRHHYCDLLLDQNLGRQSEHYLKLVPTHCQVFTGPQFALLRPEFAALRPYSLRRRQAQPALRQLLVTMGGVDQPNATGQVLQALKTCPLPADCRITVVMGVTALWLQNIREMAVQMPWPTEVVVNVNDMAQRMADCDLAIGAAGSTSWERCCLGVPTLMAVLAENQKSGANALDSSDAARSLGCVSNIVTELPLAIADLIGSERLSQMSHAAIAVTDGRGVEKLLEIMGTHNA